MKKFKHILAVLCLAAIIICAVPSCSSANYALKIGDIEISRKQYELTAKSIKSQFFTETNVEETDELWDQYIDETYSSTTQEYLDAKVQSYIITYNLYAIHFDELGLKLDDAVVKEIEDSIDALIKQYGDKAKFKEVLEEQGYSYDQFVEQYYNEAKEEAVIMHYFGPDSTVEPTPREEIQKYYNEYYSKVKHIFFSTRDSETNDYTHEKKAEIGEKAQRVYERIMNGEDYEKLLDEYNEDTGMVTNPDGYVFSSEDTSYVPLFVKTSFDMQPGDVRLIQTYMGYHIIKKYSFTDDDTFASENEKLLIENMKSTEMSDLLDELKERIGVTYNNTVLEELSVKNLPRVTEVKDPSQELKDQLTSAADALKGESEEE